MIGTLKKARIQMLTLQANQNKAMRVSIVSKQSQSGLSSNDRLLVWVQGEVFGYISKFQQNDNPANIDIKKCKVVVPVKNIIADPVQTVNSIQIKFNDFQGTKKIDNTWVLSMQSQELAKKWVSFIKEERKIVSQRRNQSTNKRSQSPVERQRSKQGLRKQEQTNKNSLISQLNQSKIQKDLNQQNNTSRLQKKQNNQEEAKAKFFIGLNKEVQKQRSQKKQQILKRKLDFQQEQQRKKLIEEIRRQEQTRLRKEKQELLLKQKQLQQKQRRIKQDQKKIQQSKRKIMFQQENKKTKHFIYSETPRGNRQQQIVINQGFFYQDKTPEERQIVTSPINKQSSIKKQQKLQGVNYSQIVNKVIFSKNAQAQYKTPKKSPQNSPISQKQQQNTEGNLFKLQKVIAEQEQYQSRQKYRSRVKQQKQKMTILPIELGWTFRYLIRQQQGTQYQIIKQFNQFCTKILKQITAQFHLPQRKKKYLPKYRREQYSLYEKDDLQFKIAFIGLKEVFNQNQFDNRDKICDQHVIKQFQQQFKNYHAIYRACREISARTIKIPLACLCEYQGFIAFFKAKSQIDNQSGTIPLDNKLQIDLQNLSKYMNISLTKLKNKQNVTLLKLNNKFYREIAAQIGKIYENFEYYIIQQVKNLMPFDTMFGQKSIKQSVMSQKQQKIQNTYYFRQQALSNFEGVRQDINQTILNSLKKSINYKQTKNKSKDPIKLQYQKMSESMLETLSIFVKQLNNLNFYFLHPNELSQKLHQNGINMRYLGLIYDNCNLPMMKYFIMTQMAARSVKAIFRKTIQDLILQQNQQQPKNVSFDKCKLQIIDFLNCILGSTNETQTVWKFCSVHSLHYFNVPLVISQIQKGYFVISLIHHCGLDVVWDKIIINQAFVTNQFFNQDNLLDIKVKNKYYEPTLTQQEKQLIYNITIQKDAIIFNKIQQQYEIQNKALPDKFLHPKYFDLFRKYCSNFISPDMTYRSYKLLNLYTNSVNPLTKTQFVIKFMQLKWHLKRQRKQKYIITFTQLNQEIIRNNGDFHPLLSQLYDIMCIYHRNNGQFDDAITFAKSSVINMLKVCGTTHPRVGQCYYQMAICCIKGGKKQQAIISLQKAKSIFQFNCQQNQISYAYVCLKLGLLFLIEQKTNQSQQIIKFSLSLFNRHVAQVTANNDIQNFEDQKVQCYEILARCYQLDQAIQQQNQLSLQCQKQIRFINNQNNIQKMLKIMLYPILSTLNRGTATIYLDIIAQMPLQIGLNNYRKGCERINERIQENSIVDSLTKYLENLKSIYTFTKENNSLAQWEGLNQVYQRQTVNDFLSLTKQLIYFLGEGFVTGSIRDSL